MSEEIANQLQELLKALDNSAGINMSNILRLPPPLRSLLNWLIRSKSLNLAQMAGFLEEDEESVHPILTALMEKGLLEQIEGEGKTTYRVRMQSSRKRKTTREDIWKVLDE